MTAYAFDVTEPKAQRHEVDASTESAVEARVATEGTESGYFVPVLELAATIGVEPTTVRRMIWSKKVEARKGARGEEVNAATLPAKYRAAYADKIALPPSVLRLSEPGERAARYNAARATGKERAEFRYEAVTSLEKARSARRPGETLGTAERRWLHNFRRSHSGRKVSLRSVKEWAAMLNAAGGNIDSLVDGNDGKQRGDRIPTAAKRMFRDEYLRAHRPNIALIHSNVVAVGKVEGWGALPSYDTFWRYATKKLPKLVRRLLRDNADTPRAVLPHVRRDPTSIGAYHTIQADHREIDVPVRCDNGCSVCTGKKPKGHFPIWTAFIDIRSRRILGTEISIDAPTSNLILGVFRRIVDENGLPWRVYLDNGSDFRKAFGKRLRKQGKTEWDGPTEERMQARFAPVGVEVVYALPYNAQAKAIERMFRTFRHRFDEDFEAYRGALGEKSEFARELYYRPSELPTISELAFLIQLAITEYNATPHTGRGMERS
jgi:hypothetical protein